MTKRKILTPEKVTPEKVTPEKVTPEKSIKLKEYSVFYGTTERETIKAANLLNAQKAAHRAAVTKKTIIISVVELKNGMEILES